ncbi:phage integrase family protein [Cupriavidus basilensis]
MAPTMLTRVHYAALRAWLQGLPLDVIAGRWLATDPDDVPGPRATLAMLHTIRDALVQRARLHGREDLANASATPGRSDKSMDHAIEAVRCLESMGTPQPLPEHDVGLWLAAPLARRLRAAGIVTLADLAALCNQRGRSWWRHVPRIGPLAAERIVQILVQHSPSIGQLGAHVTGTALATPAVAAPLQASSGAAVPLEAMRLPPTLDGADGINRAPRDVCMIGARDDYQAIQAWLSLWPADSQTHRAYRKEAERFLAWIILERGKAFSSALTDECIAYRAFLADPQPAARWCGPRSARTIHVGGFAISNPAWRPFTGALSSRSRAYSETVLASLCAWLTDRHYLVANPWCGVPAQRTAKPALQVERAVPMRIWHAMSVWLDAEASFSPRGRLLRVAILLLRETGMRCSEAAHATRANLVLRQANGAPAEQRAVWGELRVLGKGNRERLVPISRRLVAALEAHWQDRTAIDPAPSDEPLIAPLAILKTPRARSKQRQCRHGYSDRGPRQLVNDAAEKFGAHLAQENPELWADMGRIHPHAFRHAFGSHGLAAGMALNVMQGYLGHTSIATTTLYSTADRDRRLQDVEKFYRGS